MAALTFFPMFLTLLGSSCCSPRTRADSAFCHMAKMPLQGRVLFFSHFISLQIIIIDSLVNDSQLSKNISTLSLPFLSSLLVGMEKSNSSLFLDPSHPQPRTTAIFWLETKADFRNLEIR